MARMNGAGIAAALVLAAFPGAASAQPAANADTERLALARDIVANSFPPAVRMAAFSGAIKSVMAQIQSGQNNPVWLQKILVHVAHEVEDESLPVLQRHLPDMIDSYARA